MKQRSVQAYACMALGLILCSMLGFMWGRGSLIIARQAIEALQSESYYDISADELDQAAVKGMLGVLPDPMAGYLTPQSMDSFAQHLNGQKTIGLGLESVRIAQGYYIASVLENSPAQIGGIAKGDIVVAINGVSVDKGAVWPVCVQDEKIELVISRNGSERTQNVFAMALDPFPDVEQSWLDQSIGYVRIRSFTQNKMETQVLDALRKFLQTGAAVLDLRHNPGGRLDAAITIAQAFVPKGKLLLTLNEAGNKTETYRSGGGSLSGKKLYILVDEQSASASEILAGILQDYGNAVLIGVKTYGKGTVQRVAALKNGGGIRFTVAEYVLPSGLKIDGKGLTPDIITADEEIPGWAYVHSRDEMLQIALQRISESEAP